MKAVDSPANRGVAISGVRGRPLKSLAEDIEGRWRDILR